MCAKWLTNYWWLFGCDYDCGWPLRGADGCCEMTVSSAFSHPTWDRSRVAAFRVCRFGCILCVCAHFTRSDTRRTRETVSRVLWIICACHRATILCLVTCGIISGKYVCRFSLPCFEQNHNDDDLIGLYVCACVSSSLSRTMIINAVIRILVYILWVFLVIVIHTVNSVK